MMQWNDGPRFRRILPGRPGHGAVQSATFPAMQSPPTCLETFAEALLCIVGERINHMNRRNLLDFQNPTSLVRRLVQLGAVRPILGTRPGQPTLLAPTLSSKRDRDE